MFLESIQVIETSPCLADEERFKARTLASANLNELLPYLNALIDDGFYRAQGNSLSFKKGIVGFTLMNDQINITKFLNNTELYELLDWVQELINKAHDRMDEITPDYETRETMPVLQVYKLLPKTNCKKCGEATCMAFAAKLNQFETRPDECPLLSEVEYLDAKNELETVF